MDKKRESKQTDDDQSREPGRHPQVPEPQGDESQVASAELDDEDDEDDDDVDDDDDDDIDDADTDDEVRPARP